MTSRFAVATFLAGIGALGAIAVAPLASADEPDMPDCTHAGSMISGSSTLCESPGNAQLTSSPGELGEQPEYGMWPWGGGIGVL
ncbi:hypothetical protein [Mycobacteroides immunogenum]|uniref:hypothetical protein n=1 Tax=Mycobacteroides immunogenum TaxID=83262 RepID=UPI0007E2FF92|nr:hypothetical protein [Mycobacteroides immunogenum]